MGVSQSKWIFAITDYQGNLLGPVLGARVRTFNHPLNGMRTASFSIDFDNPAAMYLFNPPKVNGYLMYPLLKVYRVGRDAVNRLLMVGDITSMKFASRSSEGGSEIQVVAADGLWRLQKRLVGMGNDTYGRGQGYTYGTPEAQVYLGAIVDDLLNDTNTATGATGVLRGLVPTNTAMGAAFPAVYQQQITQMIAQISALAGGPDYEITPMEPVWNSSGHVANIGTLNQFYPLGGFQQCSFEFGVGQLNVANYELNWDRTGQINKAWSLPQGFPDSVAAGDAPLNAVDSGNIGAYGVWEDGIPSSVTSSVLRQALCESYVNIRKLPRQQITFTPVPNIDVDYGVDYLPGDVVNASAVDQGIIIYDGNVRVYGCSFTVGDNEDETVSLTLIPST